MNYVGFWRRLVAFILDAIILIIPTWVLSVAFPYVGGLIIGMLYTPLFLASELQSTPGKALMGLKVKKENGLPLTFKDGFVRYFSTFISSILLGFGYVFCVFTAKKQNLHDMIAETVVVDEPNENINYFAAWVKSFKNFIGVLSGEPNTVTAATQNSYSNVGDVSSYQTSQNPVEVTETVVQAEATTTSVNHDLLHKLEELKKMLDSGLISQEDYDTKKQDLLSKF